MACLNAAVSMTMVCILQGHMLIAFFQMGFFIVARFLLTSTSHGPSSIAELLV